MISNSHKSKTLASFHIRLFPIAILSLIFTVLGLSAPGQTVQPDRGAKLGNSYQLGDFDTINTTNGNLMINLQLGQLPPGRGSATAGVFLTYNSKLYNMRTEPRPDPRRVDATYNRTLIEPDLQKGGWRIGSGYSLEFPTRFGEYEPPCTSGPSETNEQIIHSNKLLVVFPDGSSHEMIPLGHKDKLGDRYFNISMNGMMRSCNGPPTYTTPPTYYSLDGSFLRLVPADLTNWILYFPDGSKVENGTRIYDRNGNYVDAGYGASDPFGRSVNITWANATDQLVTSKGFQGANLVWRIRWKTIRVNKTYVACPSHHSCPEGDLPLPPLRDRLQAAMRVVDKVFQPDALGGGVYTFTYNGSDVPTSSPSNGWGEISGIELPSGAQMTYAYAMDGLDGPQMFEDTDEILKNHVSTKTLRYALEYEGSAGDEAVETWTYELEPEHSSVKGPDGSVTRTEFGITDAPINGTPPWNSGLTLATYSPDGTKVENLWQRNAPTPCTPSSTCSTYFPHDHADNPYIKTTFTSLRDSNGYTMTAIKDFDYDKNGNVTEIREYDHMPYAAIPRVNDRPIGLPGDAGTYLKRITRTEYHNDTPGAASTDYLDPDGYHRPSSKRLLKLPRVSLVTGANQAPQSRVETVYDHTTYDDNNTVAGNPVTTRTWDSTKSAVPVPATDNNSLTTRASYNIYGMPVTTTDANGTVTRMTYGEISGPGGSVVDLYPTVTVAAIGTPVARTSTAAYDFHTGLTTSVTDVDNAVTTTTNYDGVGRPRLTKSAVGTPAESWVRTEYDDDRRYIVSRSDLETPGDGRKVATQFFDPIGRVRLSKTLEDPGTQSATNETDGIKVQTRYLSEYNAPHGFTYKVTSNPYRAASLAQSDLDETMGWTRSKAWHTGKRHESETFSGSTLPQPWGTNAASTGMFVTEIDANSTVTTDQAGKKRRSITDYAGQLTRMDEPDVNGELGDVHAPAQPTRYLYNALGSLVNVQQGVQNRYFMYDSIGRLIRVRQPEQEVNQALATSGNPGNNSWTAGFAYDGNGNTVRTQDAGSTVITTSYDALNRPVRRGYSDQTPEVTFIYDQPNVAFSKGKLTKIISIASEMRYLGYDATGRITAAEQMTDGRSYPTLFRYDLAGNLTEQTYPSGRTLNNFRETDGDISSIASRAADGPFRNYAGSFAYNAAGQVKHLQLGNGLWESARLNARGQVTELSLGNSPTDGRHWRLNYHYGEFDQNGAVDPSRNAGNIARQTIGFEGLASPFVQDYRYDSLDRLREATEVNGGATIWSQSADYDRYGNRTAVALTIGGTASAAPALQIDVQTNRFRTGQGYSYDPVGNLVRDAQGREFQFNGDNKQVEVRDGQGNVIGRYVYDGTGKRVKKITATETTVFVYDGLGKLVAEMSNRQPVDPPTVTYTATDPLGSPRVLTDSRGQIVSRRDFMPFGEELPGDTIYRTPNRDYGDDSVRQKFTGYQRDEETGLDFAEARMYESRHGRFTAVDPLLASGKSANPQTFNRYVYTMNRPLILVDPSGLQAATTLTTVPNRVMEIASQRTATTTTSGSSAILPPSMVRLKQQLAVISYTRQSEIANQNKANWQAGSEQNPERYEKRADEKQTNSNSSSSGVGGGVGISKDPGVSINSSSNTGQSTTSESSAGATETGSVSSTTPQLKELLKTTNSMIVDYLNKNEDRDGRITMPVILKNGKQITGSFSRRNVQEYLETYVNSVRTTATCDTSPTACSP